MSHVVRYGFGPYFTQLTVKDIVEGKSFFTLQFQETLTTQVKKQMDLLVCYWSESQHEVKVKYLTSLMLGQAKAVDVVTDMMIALEKLAVPIKLMVSLGMDGPNVNISIMEKLNKIKREKCFQQLVKCPPSCQSYSYLSQQFSQRFGEVWIEC